MKIFTNTCLVGALLLFPVVVWGAELVPYAEKSFIIDYGGGYKANVTIAGKVSATNVDPTVYSPASGFNFNGFSADTKVSIQATGPAGGGATNTYIKPDSGSIIMNPANDKSRLDTTVGAIRKLSNPQLTVRQAGGETKTTGIVPGTESSSLPFLEQSDPPSPQYGRPDDPSESKKSPSDRPGGGGSGSTGGLVPCDGVNCTIEKILDMGANIYNYLVGMGALIAVGAIIMAGFSYIKSGGDPSEMKEAKKKVIYAITGLIILGVSVLLVNTVLKVFKSNIQTVESVGSSSK